MTFNSLFQKKRNGWRAVMLAASIVTIFSGVFALRVAESGPQPPCGTEAIPDYAELDRQPNTRFWERSKPGQEWTPPLCTGWTTQGFATLIATAGRFRSRSDAEGIRRRIGAISEMKGLLYWSTTHKEWQKLIVDAYAVTGATSGQRRRDFSSDELSKGSVFYYEQSDNLTGKAIYRMRIIAVSSDRLVFATENITTMRYLLIPVLHSGDLQSIYFLERESNEVWKYYSVVRTGMNANRLTTGHEASSVNRAVAYFRYLADIPTNLEPPAAR